MGDGFEKETHDIEHDDDQKQSGDNLDRIALNSIVDHHLHRIEDAPSVVRSDDTDDRHSDDKHQHENDQMHLRSEKSNQPPDGALEILRLLHRLTEWHSLSRTVATTWTSSR